MLQAQGKQIMGKKRTTFKSPTTMFRLHYFYNLVKNNIEGDPISYSSSLPTFYKFKVCQTNNYYLHAFFMEAVGENLTQSETAIKRLLNAHSLVIEFP